MAPAAVPVVVHSPTAWLIDLVNGIAAGQDIALASLLVLCAVAGVAAAWVRQTGVTAPLAVALGVGLTFLRTPWATQRAGDDALALLLLLCIAWRATGWAVRPPRPLERGLVALACLALVVHQPMLSVVLAAVALGTPSLKGRSRVASALALLGVGALAAHHGLWRAMHDAACLTETGAAQWAWQVMHPGRLAGDGLLAAFGRTRTALVGDVHLFGLVAATWAVWDVGRHRRSVRRLTFVTVAIVVAAAAGGFVPPSLATIVLTVCWFPWFAAACQTLWMQGAGPWRHLAHALLIVVACGLPLARHAVYVPGPIVAGAPAVWAHVRPDPGDLVAVADTASARVMHRLGFAIAPARADLLAPCLGDAGAVLAVGGAVEALWAQGAALEALPVTVPLVALLGDLRPGAVVAIATTPEARRQLRPSDAEALTRAGLAPSLEQRLSGDARVAVVARGALADHAATVLAADVGAVRVDAVGTRPLWLPVSVRADGSGVDIGVGVSGAETLVRSSTAALAVFDRTERPLLRAAADARPGLPLPLVSPLAALQFGRVTHLPDAPGRLSGYAPASLRARRTLLPQPVLPVVDDDLRQTVDVWAGDGWHETEPVGRQSMRWSAGIEAAALFWLPTSQPLTLVVHASPARTPGIANRLSLRVNDTEIVSDVDRPTTVAVPQEATRPGLNTLTFVTEAVVPPGTVEGEPRPLGAVVRALRVVRR